MDFPRKSDSLIEPGYTYLNAAYTHPIPRASMDAARRAAEGRATLPPPVYNDIADIERFLE